MNYGNDANAFLIDTNQYQGTENWAEIAQAKIHGILPVRGVMIRASQGLSVDAALASAAAGADAQSLYRGFYHTIVPQGSTFTALTASAKSQASFFVKAVASLGGWYGRCLNPGVDIESNPFGLTPGLYNYWLEQFLTALSTQWGGNFPLKPMPYLDQNAWSTLLGKTTNYQSYPLWAADWGVNVVPDYGGWTEWLCWQWSSPGPLSGVPHDTDYDEWASATLPQPIPAPASTQKSSAASVPAASSELASLLTEYLTLTEQLAAYIASHTPH